MASVPLFPLYLHRYICGAPDFPNPVVPELSVRLCVVLPRETRCGVLQRGRWSTVAGSRLPAPLPPKQVTAVAGAAASSREAEPQSGGGGICCF